MSRYGYGPGEDELTPSRLLRDDDSSILKRLGLSRHDVRDLAHTYIVKHSPVCRAFNPKGEGRSYRCICDFFAKIATAAWREFDSGFGYVPGICSRCGLGCAHGWETGCSSCRFKGGE